MNHMANNGRYPELSLFPTKLYFLESSLEKRAGNLVQPDSHISFQIERVVPCASGFNAFAASLAAISKNVW